MKIAVLADIHGNVFALEAVLADAEKKGATQLLNLGDVLYGPLAPRATYEMLRGLDAVTISGNQDRQIVEAAEQPTRSNAAMEFVLSELGASPVAWLESLPFDHLFSDAIYLCHGSPTDDMEYLLENIEKGHPLVREDGEILGALGGQTAPLILCGHTHLPRVVALSSGQLVVNPGSVGLPAYADDAPVAHAMQTFSPHASYAILESGPSGWTVQQLKVPYDYEKAAHLALQNQREDWAFALQTGRS